MVTATEIEDRSSPKPFLGGWRSVNRDLEYHNATSQTRSSDFADQPRLVSVPSQTISRPLQVERSVVAGGVERAAQAGNYFPELSDWTLTPRDGHVMELRAAAAVRIQRWYRVYRGRRQRIEDKDGDGSNCLPGKLDADDGNGDLTANDRSSLSTLESLEDYYRTNQAIPSIQEISSQLHLMNNPAATNNGVNKPLDLAVLRSLVEYWSVTEEARIRESYNEAEARIAARARKLEQEVEALRAIESSRSSIARRRAERARATFLHVLARPVLLRGYNAGKQPVSIDTLSVQRAREFKDVYDALRTLDDYDNNNEQQCDPSNRVELLYLVKRIASQHTCAASTSLENLIDQELYLLEQAASPSSRLEPRRLLRHLRSRVRLAFLNLARNALAHHDNRAKESTRTRLCPSCGRLRGFEAFETDHRERVSRTCVDCRALRPGRRPGHYPEIYERMLRELRRHEAVRRDGASSLAFVVGPKAVGYLVNDIWHGRSVFSGCDELERLRLARLDPRKPWMPWNNLLATRRETRMHEVLASDSSGPPDAYDGELVRKLRRMNSLARLYFESMVRYHSDPGMSL